MLGALLRRPVGVGVSLLAALTLGVIAYVNIPLQLIPSGFDPLFLWVSVPTWTATSSENELAVAEPIEDALSTLSSLESMRSFVRSDSVAFGLELRNDADVNLSYQRVRERLRATLPSLPLGARFAYIWRHDPNEDPVYVAGVEFPEGAEDPARAIEEVLARAVERVEGVSQVQLAGITPEAVRVQLRDADLKRAGLSATQVKDTLERAHFTLSAGVIEGEGQRSWVRVSSRFKDLDTLRALPLSPTTSLGDVARVTIAPDPTPKIYRINGKPAAALTVFKASSANTIEVSRRVTEALNRAIREVSALQGFQVRPFFDQGDYILSSLNQIKSAALYGGLIAVVCLFLFLRSLSLTLLISSAIPLCLLSTVGALYVQGESLNILTMMGLILSVGMVIDNAIVVLEQVARHRAEGEGARAAALKGSRGVALAITLATLTTLVVFLPLMMVSDQPMLAFFITKVGAPVSYGLLASLVIALIHLPTASQWLSLKGAGFEEESDKAVRLEGGEGLLTRLYLRLLSGVFRHRLWLSLATLLYLASAGFPLKHLNRTDQGGGGIGGPTLHIRGPHNGPQARLLALTQEVERRLLEHADELDIEAVISEPGWSAEHVRVNLSLKPQSEQRLTRGERIERLKKLAPERPGFQVRLFRGGNRGGGDGVTLSVFGPDLDSTTALAEGLAERLRALPMVGEAELELPEGAPELTLALKPVWASALGLTPAWVAQSLSDSLQARPVGRYYGEGRELEVIVEPAPDGLNVEGVGRRVPLPPQVGGDANQAAQAAQAQPYEGMTLEGVSERRLRVGTGKIRRMGRKVHVEIEVNPRASGEEGQGALMTELEAYLEANPAPIGYGVNKGERFEDREENERGGLFATLTGVLLVLCIMGVLFESFMVPLAIFFTIPLAFVGAFWMLWATSTPLEVMAIIGGVILVGVVVNHGIVLIDQVQGLRRAGASREQALTEAARTRLRPILMTSLTTIGGLIPMAMGGAESVGIDYRPLGRVVIGGMISSTLLTLIVVPLFYTLLDDLSQLPQRLKRAQSALRGHLKRSEEGVKRS